MMPRGFFPALAKVFNGRSPWDPRRGDIARGEKLALHYQPLCDSATLDVLGYEALLRWHHPVFGAIAPARIVTLADHAGLSDALGRWVLDTACREAAAWPSGQYVAVNLSPAQLRQDDLAHTIVSILRESGLPPDRLELDIPARALSGDPARVAACLRALRATGARLALDDFLGAGGSGLSCLRRLPVDRVKIDRSLIRALGGHDGAADRTVRRIIGLGLRVTAEGVETPAQLRALQARGRTHVQGFLLGRPAPERRPLRWWPAQRLHAEGEWRAAGQGVLS